MAVRSSTLLVAFASAILVAGCGSGYACITDDPPAFVFHVRSAQTGERLAGVTGTVTSRGEARPLICGVSDGVENCEGWAFGTVASMHVERVGFRAWDSTGLRLEHSGGDCPRPILKTIEIALQPN